MGEYSQSSSELDAINCPIVIFKIIMKGDRLIFPKMPVMQILLLAWTILWTVTDDLEHINSQGTSLWSSFLSEITVLVDNFGILIK